MQISHFIHTVRGPQNDDTPFSVEAQCSLVIEN